MSATNASEGWFPSRTATLSADDSTGGAGVNSGLLALRYSWNNALNAACTSGFSVAPGTTLTAPAGDNVLYLCARDNTGRVGAWSGRYRVGTPPVTVTTTPSPSQSPHGTTLGWWATASGGSGSGYQFALFRRRPGGSWIPSLNAPDWQTNQPSWTPTRTMSASGRSGGSDGATPSNANTYGYPTYDPGPVEVVEPRQDFIANLTPAA